MPSATARCLPYLLLLLVAPVVSCRAGDAASECAALPYENARIQAAVYLYNVEYWEVRSLEVTNTGPQQGNADQQYVGIKALNGTGGWLHHIYVGYCDVHHVTGIRPGVYGLNGGITILADTNNS